MRMVARSSRRLVPGQGNQHRLRQRFHARLPQHVDDLRRRVVGVGADVEQDVAPSEAEPGPEASVRKALADQHGQRLFNLAIDLCGPDGLMTRENPPQLPGSFPWSMGFLFSPALTIGGGTSEVQRNIIAERVLGLPRDPA